MKRLLMLSLAFCIIFSGVALAGADYVPTSPERKKLNTFFSNFSEAYVESFTQETLTEKNLLDFALIHSYINNPKSLIRFPDNLNVGVPAKLVDRATERYFGRTISRHEQDVYKMPLASGEAYTFSQINRVVPLGANRFQAEGFIYQTGSGGTPDPHGTPAEWVKAGEDVDQVGRFSAVIKKVGSGGNMRYILLEYKVDQQ